ncbi:MAG: glycoside hydrolase family 3 N-terminal domain-containing protein [Eubacteriales bacterium]
MLSFAREYLRACQQRGVACSVKHFPGDGRDERDQHLCTTVNDLSVEEWDKTYGKIYRTLIEDGAKTVMVGHIMQPAYSRMLVPGIRDEEIMPATLAPELLQGLLRERLGFNGLIITDATTMAGFDAAMEREKSVPYAIAAGCDMFLFSKNLDEDYAFMKQGVEDGIITRERLDEAVLRILALKASLKLHTRDNLPSLEHMRQVLGCPAHRDAARAIADASITLVKNRENVLPISPDKTKRILIYDIESGENAIGYARSSGVYESLAPLLEKEGFTVARFVPAPGNEGKTVRYGDMTGNYDLMIYVCNLATKSNQTTVRIEWLNPMGINVPRYVEGVPTIFISTENPYHLLDVPMVKTYINTYGINDSTMPLLVEKLMGRSEFKGVSPVDPFCGKWDARR